MTDTAIRAEGLGKRFSIPAPGRLPTSERLRHALRASRRAADLWALRGVDLEVAPGEAVGIIGANGSGKSTLLKILSRITPPTEGRAAIRGRVASLLEVGTGFHPELTGRENIYMNGAILGMRKAEIDRRFDEIVAFSGVAAFLDTPVKRFSSGMRVRLAFSVAAHLQADILLVDEVLAVGDAAFQRRCFEQLDGVTQSGRTVLFVSHDMAAVSGLCSRALLLEKGRVEAAGPSPEVVEAYLARAAAAAEIPVAERRDRIGNGRLRFTRLRIAGGGREGGHPISGRPLAITLGYETADEDGLEDVGIAVTFLGPRGEILFCCDNRFQNQAFEKLPRTGEIVCEIPSLPLAAGRYRINVCAILPMPDDVVDLVRNAASFSVAEGDFFGTGRTTIPSKHGPFLVRNAWRWSDGAP